MLRRVEPGERPQLEAFLTAHIETSMFPLDNLRRNGMEDRSLPRAMQFWRSDGFDAVLGLSNEGVLFPQAPNVGSEFWAESRTVVQDRALGGVLGEAGQCRALISALGLGDAPAVLDHDEPHFSLALDAMRRPATRGLRLTPLDAAPRETLIAWRAAYQHEVAGRDRQTAEAQAPGEIDGFLRRGSHRLLWRGDTPVCLTGFNATVGDVVQIGGVYTPPEFRRQGFARAAVALHLAEAQAKGTTRALLFAANVAAARAYQAIGFQPIGEFALVVWDPPQHLTAHG